MPQYTFRIRVDPNPNAGSRIIGDVFRSQIQGEADEVTVESLQPVASPSIKNNKLFHPTYPSMLPAHTINRLSPTIARSVCFGTTQPAPAVEAVRPPTCIRAVSFLHCRPNLPSEIAMDLR